MRFLLYVVAVTATWVWGMYVGIGYGKKEGFTQGVKATIDEIDRMAGHDR